MQWEPNTRYKIPNFSLSSFQISLIVHQTGLKDFIFWTLQVYKKHLKNIILVQFLDAIQKLCK